MTADFFIRNPGYALVPAAALFVLALLLWLSERKFGSKARWSLGGVGILWVMYAFWEYQMTRTGVNIRVDLLLLYPVLGAISLGAVLHAVFAMVGMSRNRRR